MKFSIDKQDTYVVFEVQQDKLNSVNAPELKSELIFLNTEGYKNLIIDLSMVEFIDSSGLSALLVGNRLCKDAGGTFVLSSLKEPVQSLIKISQLEGILNIFPTVQEGRDFVMMEELERDLKG